MSTNASEDTSLTSQQDSTSNTSSDLESVRPLPKHRTIGGKEHFVLVVHGVASGGSSYARVLRNYSISARSYSDPLRAREWLAENRNTTIALVVDENVPIFGGEKVVELLEEAGGDIPAALLANSVEPELLARFLVRENRSLFTKPVDYGALVPWIFQKFPSPILDSSQ
ncbi:MAG: hypothetical protein KDD64_15140 [Bdellovibrionales bacterium]|nr:hypothetical protein [Bdellovibrionales bacterium]